MFMGKGKGRNRAVFVDTANYSIKSNDPPLHPPQVEIQASGSDSNPDESTTALIKSSNVQGKRCCNPAVLYPSSDESEPESHFICGANINSDPKLGSLHLTSSSGFVTPKSSTLQLPSPEIIDVNTLSSTLEA